MVTCQSANQIKTPANVSRAFKMVSQFGSLDYTIMGKTADLTVVQKTIIDTLHKEGKPQTFIAKEAGCSQSAVSSMLTESWGEVKSVEEKDAQPTERTAALWGLSSKIDSRIWGLELRTAAIENLWGIVKKKMRNKRPKNADELKATVKETWASIPPQQCHKRITSMPHRIETVIKAKGAPTKYWVHI